LFSQIDVGCAGWRVKSRVGRRGVSRAVRVIEGHAKCVLQRAALHWGDGYLLTREGRLRLSLSMRRRGSLGSRMEGRLRLSLSMRRRGNLEIRMEGRLIAAIAVEEKESDQS
jgi:hypothetical protein